jgi:pimeloyl-ACP methyl ester carboxylesterase
MGTTTGRTSRRRRFWLTAAAPALVLGLAASWGVGEALTRPSPSEIPAARPPARDVRLRTEDGVSLAATYWPGRTTEAPAVLLLHGVESSRASMTSSAAWLAGNGYAALTIDFRGYGESTPAAHSFGLNESRDAAAALAWLKRRQGGAPVAILGVSMGGAASLLGERGPLPADALILQAVYPDIRHAIRNRIGSITTAGPALLLEPLLSFQSKLRLGVWPDRLSPLAALRSYRGPLLVVGGGADVHTPPAETRALYAAAPGPKALFIADGADHAQTSGLATEAYREIVLAFLRRSMPRPAEQALATPGNPPADRPPGGP